MPLRFYVCLLALLFVAGCGSLEAEPEKQKKPARSGQMGGLVEDAYLDDLKSHDAEVRRSAARELGNVGSAKAIPALKTALGDENEGVRKEAQAALKKIQK